MTESKDSKGKDNIILVGQKPVRSYAEAVRVQFEELKSEEVILKTRGKFIVTAFNVAEFLKRTREDIEIKSIVSTSETFRDEEKDKDIYVSSVEITLKKK